MSETTKRAELEEWETMIPGLVAVSHTDRHGDEKVKNLRGRGQKFRISPEDRELNQQRYHRRSNDPFTNGMLHARKLTDRSADFGILDLDGGVDEPITEDEMVEILGMHPVQAREAIGRIALLPVLYRLAELCRGNDDVAPSVTQLISERIAALDERRQPLSPEPAVAPTGDGPGDTRPGDQVPPPQGPLDYYGDAPWQGPAPQEAPGQLPDPGPEGQSATSTPRGPVRQNI